MARNKRMISMDIMNSDAFLDIPLTAQMLYTHLVIRADDDGFIGNAIRICRYVGCTQRDLQILIDNRFILLINNVVIVKHWKMHNNVPKDRYVPTVYQEEYKALRIKDNGSYTECKQNDYTEYNIEESFCKQSGDKVKTDCNQNVSLKERERVKVKERVKENKNTLVHSGEMHDTENPFLEQFFESIWKLYPLKKGKGQVSKTKKQVLQRIGYEQIKRCVDRYVTEIRFSGKEKFMMHGSTFFNSGYVDYLDENYVDREQPAEPTKESDPEDRFSCLEPDMRSLLESCGVIDGQSLDLGNATDEQIKYLQECGVL